MEEDRDDEMNERQIAHAFIEKLKDDLEKLRDQIIGLGGKPVLSYFISKTYHFIFFYMSCKLC